MANLSNKFVTSFTELYFRPSVLSTSEKSDPKSWFSVAGTGATAKVFTVSTAVTTAVAGTLVLRYTNAATGAVDSFAVTVAGGATQATIAANIKTALDANADITGGSVTTGSFDATLLASAGDASLVVEDTVGGVTVTITEDTAYAAGTGGTMLIPNVMEVGSLSNEATVIDTPTFGEAFKGKLRGQLDAGQLDAQLYWAPRNAVHLAMREAATNGTSCSFGIKWKSDAAGTAAEYVVFDGFLSSFGIDTSFDDVAKASSTMIVDGALTFDGDV